MKEPKAKKLVACSGGSSMLFIDTASADATEFVKREAPRFGHFYLGTQDTPESTTLFHADLFVSDCYSSDEVARYLESINSPTAKSLWQSIKETVVRVFNSVEART